MTHASETVYVSIFRCNGGKGEAAVVGSLESASINLNTVRTTLHSFKKKRQGMSSLSWGFMGHSVYNVNTIYLKHWKTAFQK